MKLFVQRIASFKSGMFSSLSLFILYRLISVMNSVRVIEVADERELGVWIGLYEQIFYDKSDMMTADEVRNEFSARKYAKYFLVAEDGENIGIRCQVIMGDKAFDRYGGLVESRRNMGIFRQVMKDGDKYLKSAGVHLVVAEAEHPEKVPDGMTARRRIKFLENIGYRFVEFPRPATDNPNVTQYHLLLGFRFLGENPDSQRVVHGDAIDIEFYRMLYRTLMAMDYNMESPDEIDSYPAVREFEAKIDVLKSKGCNSCDLFPLTSF